MTTMNLFNDFRSRSILIPCIAFGSALIVYAARGDLWLDEIWSISMAEAASSPWDIVTLFKHDNNHVLNTLYLYMIGPQKNLLVYRLLSVLSGIASLFVLSAIARKWGTLESVLVVILAGCSYPLLLYFSEARGYAPAIFFALLSLYVLERYLCAPCIELLVIFWMTIMAGIVAHLSCGIVFLSLSVYVIYREKKGEESLRCKAVNIIKLLFLPALFTVFFYYFYAAGITIGGGPVFNIPAEIAKGDGLLIGFPDDLLFLSIPAALMVVGSGVYFLLKQKDHVWVYYAAVTIAAPLAVIIIMKPIHFYFRYLIVTFPFFYLLTAYALGRTYRSGLIGRALLVVVLLAYGAGQAQRIVPFLGTGRGHYRKIMTELSEKSDKSVITIGSDHDFRNKMLVAFYSRFVPPGRKIYYIDRQNWNVAAPDWMILHSLDPHYEPSDKVLLVNNQRYRFTTGEKFFGNSGFSWFLYHKGST